MRYTLDEFKNVWNGNSANDILNQFYYEHIELQKALERTANLQIDKIQLTNNWNELEEWLKDMKTPKQDNFGDYGYTWALKIDVILDKMKEIQNGSDDNE